jgi:hypothetical protein
MCAYHNEGMHPALRIVAADLQRIFGARLQSLVAYGPEDHPDGVHTLALVERLDFQDLTACAPRNSDWQRAGAAVPLLLSREEFLRTLDVFPLEYGGIIASHQLIAGQDVLGGMRVTETDLRRGCELQAKSHLIHLREGYLETLGDPARAARLMAASAPALRALMENLLQLDGEAAARAGLTPELVREVAAASTTYIADPSPLLARYLSAVERLWQEVDRWRP